MLNQLAAPVVIGSERVSTGPLLVASSAVCRDLPSYTPAVLLDARFSVVLTDTVAFQEACAEGFEMYCVEQSMYEAQSYEWADLIEYLIAAAAPWDMRGVPATPVVWSAGFMLGWLSAHARVDRPAALMALEVLYALVGPSLSLVARG